MWAKIKAALKRVAKLEPVAVQSVVRAVFVLAATVGVAIPDEVQTKALGAVVALYALLEVAGALWARVRVTPSAKVVEEKVGKVVVAGPANERVPAGQGIRYTD